MSEDRRYGPPSSAKDVMREEERRKKAADRDERIREKGALRELDAILVQEEGVAEARLAKRIAEDANNLAADANVWAKRAAVGAVLSTLISLVALLKAAGVL